MAPSARKNNARKAKTLNKKKTTKKKQQQLLEETSTSTTNSLICISCDNNSLLLKKKKKKKVDIENSSSSSSSVVGCTTPKAQKYQIPEIQTCPPAPKKKPRLSSCTTLRRTPISFFEPPDIEIFFASHLASIYNHHHLHTHVR